MHHDECWCDAQCKMATSHWFWQPWNEYINVTIVGIHAYCCCKNMVVGYWCLICNKPIWCIIRHVHGLFLIKQGHLMKSSQIVYRHDINNNTLQPLNLDYHLLGRACQHISTLVAMDNKSLIMANNLHTIDASEVVSSVGNDQLACEL